MLINVTLSKSGIDKAVEKIEQYKSDLRYKLGIFVRRLAEEGYRVINEKKKNAGEDADTSFTPVVVIKQSSRNVVRATLSISGKDVLFVEFGAGVHYNGSLGSSPNPKGLEFGYFIGSYPGQSHAGDDYWWYTDDSGRRHMTHGTKAAMPMYSASESIRGHFASIAREVFSTAGGAWSR